MIRHTTRPLEDTAVVGHVELATGHDKRGRRVISIRPSGSRSGVQNIADPAAVRLLIEELQEGLTYLEVSHG